MRSTGILTLLAALLASATALATPTRLAQQGRLLDSGDSPLTGTHDLVFSLHDQADAGSVLWTEAHQVDFDDGYYSVTLGALQALDDLLFDGGSLWLELTVDATVLEPRQEIVSVPYALRSTSAAHLDGGIVDAATVSVGGTQVIDQSGNWVGPTTPTSWNNLTDIPADIADGDLDTNTQLTELQVEDYIFDDPMALPAGSTVGGTDIATGPHTTSLPWTDITAIPPDLADGDHDTDTLGDLSALCGDGDRAVYDSAQPGWICVGESVDLARLDSSAATPGQVLTFDGNSVNWEDAAAPANDPCTLSALDEVIGGALVDCGTGSFALRTWMRFSSLEAANSHTCGIISSGEAFCFGSDGSGQSTAPSGTFLQVSPGGCHSCGITPSGAVVCWGCNSLGQANAPSGIFTQVSAGVSHTCAIADTGSVHCWGDNMFGESSPPGGSFTRIAASNDNAFTCGITTSGSLQCWGDNDQGQTNPPDGTFTQVSAGSAHACAIDISGQAHCWGSNDQGRATPPSGVFTQIGSGSYHSCALDSSGAIQCWGSDAEGRSSPDPFTYSQVTVGVQYTCGILSTLGTALCWGNGGGASPP